MINMSINMILQNGLDSVSIEEAQQVANLFEKEYHLPDITIEQSSHYAYSCAQCNQKAGQTIHAIKWYRTRLTYPCVNQEIDDSIRQLAILYTNQENMDEAIHYWTLLYSLHQKEGLIDIISYFRKTNRFDIAYQYHRIMQTASTDHIYSVEWLMIAPHIQKPQYTFPQYKQLCVSTRDPSYIKQILTLLHHYESYIDLMDMKLYQLILQYSSTLYQLEGSLSKEIIGIITRITELYKPTLVAYPETIVKTLPCSSDEKILCTITTCKRFDLFEKTMNSFLQCCTDLHRITTFYCVDDNSSQEDRERMKSRYPFFEFYFKSEKEKGHRSSMNQIWKKLNEYRPIWWLHMEDDWLFIKLDQYVTSSIHQINQYRQDGVRQVLFNKNYAETFDQWNLVGGKLIEHNTYRLHIHNEPNIHGSNSAYWPHYSFRPSLIDANAIIELGNFDTPNTFFERDYANHYAAADYKSMYRNEITCLHIGKLTSDKSGINAYALNKEHQFNHAAHTSQIKIINLERREDRKQHMKTQLDQYNITGYEFAKAVDGMTLELTHQIAMLFQGNDFQNRKAVIGCALSHVNIWKELVKDPHHSYYIILEDDIEFSTQYENKKDKLRSVCDYAESHSEVDMLLLGYSMWRQDQHKKHEPSIEPICEIKKEEYIGGFFSYLLTKQGAQKILDYISVHGIKHGIDYIVKIIPNFKMMHCQPHFILTDWVDTLSSIVDTDIQKNFYGFDIDGYLVNLSSDWIFYPNLDSIGNDIHSIQGSVEKIKECARINSKCIACNTVGYLKSKITFPLVKSKYLYKKEDGIFIKKQKIYTNQLDVDWDFYPHLDSIGHDIGYERLPINQLKEKAEKDPNCIAFNTVGYLKSHVEFPLVTSPYLLKQGSGIYIKKSIWSEPKM